MSFVWYMWGYFANGAEKEKKKKKWGKERGERAPNQGARCGLTAGPGGLQPVISWGHAAEMLGKSPPHPTQPGTSVRDSDITP